MFSKSSKKSLESNFIFGVTKGQIAKFLYWSKCILKYFYIVLSMIAATGFDFEVIRGYSRSDYHALEVSLEKKNYFWGYTGFEVKTQISAKVKTSFHRKSAEFRNLFGRICSNYSVKSGAWRFESSLSSHHNPNI